MQRVLAVCFCAIALIAFPATTFADTSFTQLLSQLEQEYQLPSGILAKVAYVESGGNPNTSCSSANACGLFQWTPNSWLSATKALYNGQPLNLSERNDPTKSAVVTAYELGDIRSKVGNLITQAHVDMTVGLYLGHFLGIGGAQHFLSDYIQNPGGDACGLFPKECSYNRPVMAGRTLAGVINYFAAKLQQPGVLNVAGNFQDSNGLSYAYSSAYLSQSDFLPANTVIGTDPQYDYAPTYTSVVSQPAPLTSTTGTGTVIPNAPQTTPPASYTTPPQAAQALAASAPTAASSSGQCTPQYSCSNNTVSYQSSSCAISTFQTCQYGCAGTVCAAGTSNPSSGSSGQLSVSNIISTMTGSATSADNALGALEQFFATSTSIGTTTSLTSSSSMFSFVEEGTAVSLTTGATSSIDADGSGGFGQPTFASSTYSYSQNVYVPARVSPFTQILGQLENVLHGLLSYLQSI
jgi:hypothetical protein